MSKEQLPQISGPRLPYHPAMQEKFGVDIQQWRALTDAIFPSAETTEAIILALSYCKARNLDIMKKPVQIVPIWDGKKNRLVEGVWPGIGELRTTATRTANYAGIGEAEFGDDITENLDGGEITYPKWCRVTVYRFLSGEKCAFIGPKVFWKETYATLKKGSKAPNSQWAKRPYGQIEKCAEAAALRRAFPEEIGNEISAEEMEGKEIFDVTPQKEQRSKLSEVIDNAKKIISEEKEEAPKEEKEEVITKDNDKNKDENNENKQVETTGGILL